MQPHEKEKGHPQSGTAGVHGQDARQKIRKEIVAIREGHTTGGYVETEELQAKEKELWNILSKDLEAAKEKYGYSADPKFKNPEIRKLELEINGFSWKPKLVVAETQ